CDVADDSPGGRESKTGSHENPYQPWIQREENDIVFTPVRLIFISLRGNLLIPRPIPKVHLRPGKARAKIRVFRKRYMWSKNKDAYKNHNPAKRPIQQCVPKRGPPGYPLRRVCVHGAKE